MNYCSRYFVERFLPGDGNFEIFDYAADVADGVPACRDEISVAVFKVPVGDSVCGEVGCVDHVSVCVKVPGGKM